MSAPPFGFEVSAGEKSLLLVKVIYQRFCETQQIAGSSRPNLQTQNVQETLREAFRKNSPAHTVPRPTGTVHRNAFK